MIVFWTQNSEVKICIALAIAIGSCQAEPPHDSMQKVEDMQAWEREERSRVQKMKVGELKGMLQALDEQTYKRCKGYKKDMLVMEVMSLKREVKLSPSKVEPEAKRRKV